MRIKMKKMLQTVCIMTAAVLLTAGCGAGDNGTQNGDVSKEIVISEVVSKIKEANPVADERVIDDFAVENEMGLSMDDIAEYEGVITNSHNDCSLIFVAKANDGKTRDLKQALTDYLDSLTSNDLYVEFADKIEKAKEAKVLIYDDYVVLVIAGLDTDYSSVTAAVNEAFGE